MQILDWILAVLLVLISLQAVYVAHNENKKGTHSAYYIPAAYILALLFVGSAVRLVM